ncbi:hypothetical protein N7520_011934 [Penicillium odoratum]|uniref:uncharacterized protein n=1 Tax=Penicillium odoratum TaxID=1167516 RepID=UPI002548612A|nr:uncharacterized protein N7520_011934 [Penicillium odoratum]KAJ5746752.1 hypothetical protein N7520_011934 [Penicillium odoratum]
MNAPHGEIEASFSSAITPPEWRRPVVLGLEAFVAVGKRGVDSNRGGRGGLLVLPAAPAPPWRPDWRRFPLARPRARLPAPDGCVAA